MDEPLYKPDQVRQVIPSLSARHLRLLRYKGTGPRYYQPTPRTILYPLSGLIEWLEASERTSTAQRVPA